VTVPVPVPTDLASLGADVEWTDATSATAARTQAHRAPGRLGEILEWLAGTQGRFPVRQFTRARLIVLGEITPAVAAMADAFGVGVRELPTPPGSDPHSDTAGALEEGAAAADSEVDAGTDLLVVADPDNSAAAAVLVALLTRAEPVALLPRGAAATDTGAWIARAEHLRDTRRRVAHLRRNSDEMLTALEHPHIGVTTGLLLRAAARRTPMLLDGAAAVAAALLAHQAQSRAVRWWRVADSSADPVHTRATAELQQLPVLDLGTSCGDGTAGLLAVPVLQAAIYRGDT
jgi:nicotinate-nucleotide--dimethylbenzimidazole phosphoribosyltransferase